MCYIYIYLFTYIVYLSWDPTQIGLSLSLVDRPCLLTLLPVGSLFISLFFSHLIFYWKNQVICLTEFPIALVLYLHAVLPLIVSYKFFIEFGGLIRFKVLFGFVFAVGWGEGTKQLHRPWCLLLSGRCQVWLSFLWC